MIRVRDVRKVYPTRFGENLVLDGISFDLAKGEKLGILGRNGAGKSTLVRLISGAELPTSGKVERHMSVSWPLAFGGAFQTKLTGVDNVRFISSIYGQDAEENLEFVQSFAELGKYLYEPVKTYSSGMRARLAFAISMIIEFDCFLIDEVGAVGDARFHQRCNKELFENRADRAMILISHDAGYLRDRCNRIALLHDGKLKEFSDFDVAYSEFREKIGVEQAAKKEKLEIPANRQRLLESTHVTAKRDPAFAVLVESAGLKRDRQKWDESEKDYAAALKLYPYQRAAWVKLGHVAKRANRFATAEAAYRTGCALGEPLMNVQKHLEFVLKKQKVDAKQFPFASYAATSTPTQPPGIPDIELFAKVAWKTDDIDQGEALHFLRTHQTCDQLLAEMIGDERFLRAQRNWLDQRENEQANANSSKPSSAKGNTDITQIDLWKRNIACIACPEQSGRSPLAVAQAIGSEADAWSVIMGFGAFDGWAKTQAALEAVLEAA